MKIKIFFLVVLFSFLSVIFIYSNFITSNSKAKENPVKKIVKNNHWFLLERKSQKEYLYYGVYGDVKQSKLIKEFEVKVGAKSSPTPLPKYLDKEYWLITKKESSMDNPDTAPYFLTLNIPVTDGYPYGPFPYEECVDEVTGKNIQCNWNLPGYFGLHGINGNLEKLSNENIGSSGCIRHRDEDISYIYDLLNPQTEEIRYYIKDI